MTSLDTSLIIPLVRSKGDDDIERGMPLLHLDRDFETIATVRPLKQRRLELPEGL